MGLDLIFNFLRVVQHTKAGHHLDMHGGGEEAGTGEAGCWGNNSSLIPTTCGPTTGPRTSTNASNALRAWSLCVRTGPGGNGSCTPPFASNPLPATAPSSNRTLPTPTPGTSAPFSLPQHHHLSGRWAHLAACLITVCWADNPHPTIAEPTPHSPKNPSSSPA